MLVELVMTVCLAGTGAECHNEHLVLEAGGSAHQCIMESQIRIAQWIETHPEWKVVRFQCVPEGAPTVDPI